MNTAQVITAQKNAQVIFLDKKKKDLQRENVDPFLFSYFLLRFHCM